MLNNSQCLKANPLPFSLDGSFLVFYFFLVRDIGGIGDFALYTSR